MFNKLFFGGGDRAVNEIMWKNTVERGRPHMTTWRMRFACRIPKATDTHSQYLTLIAFPLQHWLMERASMLRYTCIACLVYIYVSTNNNNNNNNNNNTMTKKHYKHSYSRHTTTQNNIDEPTTCNNDLLIYKISSTCFGQYFAHHQERETEIFTAYGILLLWWVGRR